VYNDNSNPILFNKDKSIVSWICYYWYNFQVYLQLLSSLLFSDWKQCL